uniref:Uncharacterized protein n=1 Tax=Arundo donax TaxID=35708 RepID=A0A0A9B5B5_ARUDO
MVDSLKFSADVNCAGKVRVGACFG